MTGGRRFSAPDWGQDHLSLDAIVAFVDDELGAGPNARAEAHLARCRECRAEVVAQRQARSALRGAGGPCLPSSLLRSLRSIPVEAELPPPPPGLGITADGQFVLLRDAPRDAAPDGAGPDAARHGLPCAPGPARRRFSRRARVGTISGLALGALAVGALAANAPAAPTGPGVLGGVVLNVPARLSAVPAAPAVVPAAVPPVTPTASASTGAADQEPTASPTGDAGVLEAGLRARLDDAPIGFHRP